MAAAMLRRNPRIPILLRYFNTTSAATAVAAPLLAVKSAIESESDPEKIATLFQSATHHPTFHDDRNLYRLTVRKLSRARRPDLVERILSHQLTSDPAAPKTEGFLIRILSLYSAAGLVDYAARTFDLIPSPLSERSFCALLTAFLDNRQFDRLRDAFNTLPDKLNIPLSVIPYNILLNGLCLADDLPAARALLDEMPHKGVKPNIISYTTVLNGYLLRGDDAGFDTILKVIKSNGLKPYVVTYNCMILSLCRRGKTAEAELLLDTMGSKKVQPSRLTFSLLIDGFCKEGEMDSAMRVLEKMRSVKREDGGDGIAPTFETYIALLKGLVEKGEFVRAVEICKTCLEHKWAPPFLIVKGLVEGLIKSSRIDDAKDVAAKMKSALSGDAAAGWQKLESGFSF